LVTKTLKEEPSMRATETTYPRPLAYTGSDEETVARLNALVHRARASWHRYDADEHTSPVHEHEIDCIIDELGAGLQAAKLTRRAHTKAVRLVEREARGEMQVFDAIDVISEPPALALAA
jgi:hypothetical protein